MQVLSQACLHVYNEGETLSVETGHTQHVFVLLRGCVRIHYSQDNTYLAGEHPHACHVLFGHGALCPSCAQQASLDLRQNLTLFLHVCRAWSCALRLACSSKQGSVHQAGFNHYCADLLHPISGFQGKRPSPL